MNCEEFANAGIDEVIGGGANGSAALEHVRSCSQCAALVESSQRLRSELRELALDTTAAGAPSRVEMRLRQEFRTRYKTNRNHSRAVFVGWALAAATIVLVVASLVFWRRERGPEMARNIAAPAENHLVASGPELGGTLIAESDGHEFALIPGVLPGLQDETSVVRVQMQRGSLGALGLSVNEEHANDVVQVDLLLGEDGQPQAYRLPEANN